jgi:phosphoribosylaminoimidazolecarboxamide formyltransferase/IMP cyclohydrolase
MQWADFRRLGEIELARSFGAAERDLVAVDQSIQAMSYNNYADASAAQELCAELTRAKPGNAIVCFVKHTNACGVAVDADPVEAYRRAYLGDPNAAMGGILAVNFAVTPRFAEAAMETYQRWGKAAGAGGFFVEVWLAPAFDDPAVQVIRTKKEWGQRVRLLAVGDMGTPPDPNELDYKRIAGGMLVQTRDLVGLNEEQWKVVTKRPPTEAEMSDLRLAWLVCKHTKSNAITICRDGMLLGNGAGQMSRVMSCRIATWLAQENGHADQLRGAVAASDAFFPFRDGPDILMDAGVTAVIQPGGGKRDEDTVQACDERGSAMIFTGTRHFRH